MKALRTVILMSGVVALAGQVAVAQTTFNGLGDGTTWEDPSNWDNGAPAGNNANIHNGFIVDLSSATTINELDIAGDQGPGEATLNHSAGALAGSGWLKIGLGADAGTFNLSGTASVSGYDLTVVGAVENAGTSLLSLTDDASFSTNGLDVNGSGQVWVSGNASLTPNQISVRNTATFEHSSGDVTVTNWVSIGSDVAGDATYNLSGGTLSSANDWITVGEDGAGAMNVTDTATLEANGAGIFVGRNPTGNGTLSITGSAATVATQLLDAGVTGTALLSWTADAGGITPIVARAFATLGANSSLSVDLTADSDFASYGSGTTTLEIVLIDSAAANVGTFGGLPEGASVDIGGGKTATISYVGGDDNLDIVLQVLVDGGCASDVDGDGDVGFNDLVTLLAAWGPCPGCPADIDGDGDVGFNDLVTLLAAWGPC